MKKLFMLLAALTVGNLFSSERGYEGDSDAASACSGPVAALKEFEVIEAYAKLLVEADRLICSQIDRCGLSVDTSVARAIATAEERVWSLRSEEDAFKIILANRDSELPFLRSLSTASNNNQPNYEEYKERELFGLQRLLPAEKK